MIANSTHPNAAAALLRWALRNPSRDPGEGDWEAGLEAARAQDVHLFLYPFIKKRPGIAPDSALARLRSEFLAAVRQSEQRRVQAEALLGRLEGDRIPVIPLKGLWLGEHVYAHPAERPMHDLDILVREADYTRAMASLEAIGYAARGPGDIKHRLFVHPDWEWPVELHFRLDAPGPLALDPEPLWQRAVPAVCSGQPCLALDPGDLALTLVRHTLQHSLGFYPLRSLLDLALVLRREGPALDLHALHARAAELRMVHGLALITAMAEDLAGFEREAEWPDAWKPDPDILAESWRLTLDRGGCRANPPAPMLGLGDVRGVSARLRLLGGRLFLPHAELAARYPWARRRGMRPFALAARLGWLVRLYGGVLLRLARKDPAVLEALDVGRERRSWLARIYPDPPG